MNQGPEKAHFLARFWHHFSTSAAGKQLWVPKTPCEEVDFFGGDDLDSSPAIWDIENYGRSTQQCACLAMVTTSLSA